MIALAGMFLFGGVFLFSKNAFAASANTTTNLGKSNVSSTSSGWVEDAKVTSVGRAAARSREFLNWTLAIKDAGFSASQSPSSGYNALYSVWQQIRNVVVVLYVVIIIVIAFGLIFHTEWGEKSRRSLPAIIIAFVLTFFSFTAEVLLIQGVDRVQQIFYSIAKDPSLSADERHLRAEDLLTVGFKYQNFTGFKRDGVQFEEAVANHLNLVKATTYTNYAIGFLILIRVIILWGLVIFSPFVFPFFVFPLTKRVGTVWVREFARWVFLGPLFALFITAIPYIWQKTNINVSGTYGTDQVAKESGIPIEINKNILQGTSGSPTEQTYNNIYQSGTNLLLGPPKNASSLSPTVDLSLANGNNLSETDSYARYIVALMMIWGAIILPFLLLRYAMIFGVEIGKNISSAWGKSSAQQYFSNISNKVYPPNPNKPSPSPIDLKKINEGTRDISRFKKSTDLKNIKPTPDVIKSENGEQVRRIVSQAGKSLFVKGLDQASDFEQNNKLSTGRTMKSLIQNQIGEKKDVDATVSSSISRASMADTISQIRKRAIDNFSKDIAAQANTPDSKIIKFIDENATNVQQANFAKQAIRQISADGKNSSEITMDALKIHYPIFAPAEQSQQFLALKSILDAHPDSDISNKIRNGSREVIKANYGSGMGIERLELAGLTKQLIASISKLDEKLKSSGRSDQQFQLANNALGRIKSDIGGEATDINKITNEQITKALSVAKKIQNPSLADSSESNEFNALSEEIKSNSDLSAGELLQSANEIIESTEIMRGGGIDTVDDLKDVLQSDEELARLQQSWEKYYSQAPIPVSESIKTRSEWVKKEFELMEETLQNILSSDESLRSEGFKKIGQFLPVVMLGNFDNAQIAKYLLAKLNAAEKILAQLKDDEDNMVSVSVQSSKKNDDKNEMHFEQSE